MNNAVSAFFHRIRRTPEREAIYDHATNRRYSYRDMGIRGMRLASYLMNELHIRQGDVVALAADTSIVFPDMFYASCLCGAIITTYNPRLRVDDIAPLVKREAPRVMFVGEAYREKMAQSALEAGVDCLFVSVDGGDDCGVWRYADIMARPPFDDAEVDFDGFGEFDAESIQMLVHTGGTTGMPKSAKISYRAVFYNALSDSMTIGMTQADAGLVFLPFFHTVGWNVAMLPHLLTGGRVILTESLDPELLLHLIESEKPTMGLAVESILLRMATHPRFAQTDFSSYRFIANGAGPISESTMRMYWSRGVKIVNAYGMTEIGPNNCLYPNCDDSLEEIQRHSDTVGKPMYFNELKVVDDAGNEVPAGVDGELLWRGPVAFSGYWRNPEATAEVLCEGGWIRSGDIGRIDAEGYVHLQGRRKHMLITNGENVFPIEIENTIKCIPGVVDCFVIPVPDPGRGEVGKALVVMADGAKFSRDEILSYAKKHLATIKVPRYYTQVKDLPVCGLKTNVAQLCKLYGFAGD